MAKLNISGAAKSWGVSRQTIYNRIQEGVLSVTKDVTGATEIDTTEMLRVFGEPHANAQAIETVQALSNGKAPDVLRHQIEVETLKRTAAEERAAMLEAQLASLQKQVERLEAQSETRDKLLNETVHSVNEALKASLQHQPPRRGLLDRFLKA
jgi:DNA-binding transcriptional MerR regulator